MEYYKLVKEDGFAPCILSRIYKGDFNNKNLDNWSFSVEFYANEFPEYWELSSEEEYTEQERVLKESAPSKFFEKELASTLESIQKTLGQKGKEYSTNVDKFHNFNEGAKILGCIPEKCLDAYMTKHIVSYRDMLNRLQNGEIPSDELIDEKLGDIINYFILQKIQLKQRNNVVLPR